MSKIEDNYEDVGVITEEIADKGQFGYTGKVFLSPGAKKHILRKHGMDLGEDIATDLSSYLGEIIEKPDYIGAHPQKKGESIELIKHLEKDVLVAIEVDLAEEYIYVASMYPITKSKLQNRINSGRVKMLDSDLNK